ncbi:uncharacterized protein EHS24_008094 [Apiotrichum porosum]|uniref:DASH complex subunit SPC19 n=1 Tax=Apiotrichum porosum TaxID=105984 RepID=A0A427XSV1_9TREE|nr:uncharacterized protein EHS24_008094 [Apiotrichum porosum]RSH81897.1 hypothetical protein EHS24_008094 [Apiotrichum porosum]
MASRQSYAHGRQSYAPSYAASRSAAPRASTYPVPSNDYLNSMEECVKATEGCAATLGQAITNFEPGVADLPRLKKVLHNHHIDALLSRGESLVAAESQQLDRLEEKLALVQAAQANRLPAAPRLPGTFKDLDAAAADEDETRNRLEGVDLKDITLAQRRKIGFLRNRRDKLEKERARLAMAA